MWCSQPNCGEFAAERERALQAQSVGLTMWKTRPCEAWFHTLGALFTGVVGLALLTTSVILRNGGMPGWVAGSAVGAPGLIVALYGLRSFYFLLDAYPYLCCSENYEIGAVVPLPPAMAPAILPPAAVAEPVVLTPTPTPTRGLRALGFGGMQAV